MVQDIVVEHLWHTIVSALLKVTVSHCYPWKQRGLWLRTLGTNGRQWLHGVVTWTRWEINWAVERTNPYWNSYLRLNFFMTFHTIRSSFSSHQISRVCSTGKMTKTSTSEYVLKTVWTFQPIWTVSNEENASKPDRLLTETLYNHEDKYDNKADQFSKAMVEY